MIRVFDERKEKKQQQKDTRKEEDGEIEAERHRHTVI